MKDSLSVFSTEVSQPYDSSAFVLHEKRKNNISTILHIIIVVSVAIAIGLGLAFLNHWLTHKIKNKNKD